MKAQRQLTPAMLDEFVEFRGDMGAFVRSGRGTLQFDWDIIDELLQRTFLVRAGLASVAFRTALEADLSSIAPDEDLRQRLWDMGGERVARTHGRVVV